MTRQGPDYHDSSRQDVIDDTDLSEPITLTEEQKRLARAGSDMARLGLGQPEKHPTDSKITFTSEEAQRLARLISRSDVKDPKIRNTAIRWIDAALQRGEISVDESAGLKHYLNKTEGISDDIDREPDVRELQAGPGSM